MVSAPPNDSQPYFVTVFIALLHDRGEIPVGILLVDPIRDALYVRLPEDWTELADAEAVGVLDGLGEMFVQRAGEQGSAALVKELLEDASNYVRVGDPVTIPTPTNFRAAIDKLYAAHVTSAQS